MQSASKKGQLDSEALLTLLWVTWAGLKVLIFFIATSIFMMLAENGAIGRKWFKRPHASKRKAAHA